MTDIMLVNYDIEPGETDRLRDWLDAIDIEQRNVGALIQEEGMLTESLFIDASESGDVLVLYQEAVDM